MCVCVCVRKRERERERESAAAVLREIRDLYDFRDLCYPFSFRPVILFFFLN